jgi:hypothetical protein
MLTHLFNQLMALIAPLSFPHPSENASVEVIGGKVPAEVNHSPLPPRREGAPSEPVFLDSELVTVTVSRVIVGAKTYAMSGIISVEPFVAPRDRTAKALAVVTGGFLVLLLGLCLPEDRPIDDIFLALISFVLIGTFLWALSRWIRGSKKWRHGVAIMTASGRDVILTSPDLSVVDRVVSAINEAIVARG